MTDFEWQSFFVICNQILGEGNISTSLSNNWCSWTTFGRLKEDCGYWTSGIPTLSHIADNHIKDNSNWLQPFFYADIAHIIIPKEFFWEHISPTGYDNGTKIQNILLLSEELDKHGIKYGYSDYALDIKLF